MSEFSPERNWTGTRAVPSARSTLNDEDPVNHVPVNPRLNRCPAVPSKRNRRFCPGRSTVTAVPGPVVVSAPPSISGDSVTVAPPVLPAAGLRNIS